MPMHTEPRTEPIEKLVVHVNVGPEVYNGAEDLVSWLRTMPQGYQKVGDNDGAVTAAGDDQVTWSASFMNARGLHYCIIGYADQTPAQWDDPYSQDALRIAALVFADWCVRHDVPCRKLTPAEVATPGVKGICGHGDVTIGLKDYAAARGVTLDHYDPGPNFPWDKFIRAVLLNIAAIKGGGKPPQRIERGDPEYAGMVRVGRITIAGNYKGKQVRNGAPVYGYSSLRHVFAQGALAKSRGHDLYVRKSDAHNVAP